jgi:hypothetical protein
MGRPRRVVVMVYKYRDLSLSKALLFVELRKVAH